MEQKGPYPGYGEQDPYGNQPQPYGQGYPVSQMPPQNYQPSHVVVTQPPQSTVIVTQAMKPPNYLGLAIFVCLMCNWILGLIAIVFSIMSDSAYSSGDVEGARSKGRVSMWLSVAGMIVTVVLVVIIIILYFTGFLYAYRYYG